MYKAELEKNARRVMEGMFSNASPLCIVTALWKTGRPRGGTSSGSASSDMFSSVATWHGFSPFLLVVRAIGSILQTLVAGGGDGDPKGSRYGDEGRWRGMLMGNYVASEAKRVKIDYRRRQQSILHLFLLLITPCHTFGARNLDGRGACRVIT